MWDIAGNNQSHRGPCGNRPRDYCAGLPATVGTGATNFNWSSAVSTPCQRILSFFVSISTERPASAPQGWAARKNDSYLQLWFSAGGCAFPRSHSCTLNDGGLAVRRSCSETCPP
jgi:hypothetical protein